MGNFDEQIRESIVNADGKPNTAGFTNQPGQAALMVRQLEKLSDLITGTKGGHLLGPIQRLPIFLRALAPTTSNPNYGYFDRTIKQICADHKAAYLLRDPNVVIQELGNAQVNGTYNGQAHPGVPGPPALGPIEDVVQIFYKQFVQDKPRYCNRTLSQITARHTLPKGKTVPFLGLPQYIEDLVVLCEPDSVTDRIKADYLLCLLCADPTYGVEFRAEFMRTKSAQLVREPGASMSMTWDELVKLSQVIVELRDRLGSNLQFLDEQVSSGKAPASSATKASSSTEPKGKARVSSTPAPDSSSGSTGNLPRPPGLPETHDWHKRPYGYKGQFCHLHNSINSHSTPQCTTLTKILAGGGARAYAVTAPVKPVNKSRQPDAPAPASFGLNSGVSNQPARQAPAPPAPSSSRGFDQQRSFSGPYSGSRSGGSQGRGGQGGSTPQRTCHIAGCPSPYGHASSGCTYLFGILQRNGITPDMMARMYSSNGPQPGSNQQHNRGGQQHPGGQPHMSGGYSQGAPSFSQGGGGFQQARIHTASGSQAPSSFHAQHATSSVGSSSLPLDSASAHALVTWLQEYSNNTPRPYVGAMTATSMSALVDSPGWLLRYDIDDDDDPLPSPETQAYLAVLKNQQHLPVGFVQAAPGPIVPFQARPTAVLPPVRHATDPIAPRNRIGSIEELQQLLRLCQKAFGFMQDTHQAVVRSALRLCDSDPALLSPSGPAPVLVHPAPAVLAEMGCLSSKPRVDEALQASAAPTMSAVPAPALPVEPAQTASAVPAEVLPPSPEALAMAALMAEIEATRGTLEQAMALFHLTEDGPRKGRPWNEATLEAEDAEELFARGVFQAERVLDGLRQQEAADKANRRVKYAEPVPNRAALAHAIAQLTAADTAADKLGARIAAHELVRTGRADETAKLLLALGTQQMRNALPAAATGTLPIAFGPLPSQIALINRLVAQLDVEAQGGRKLLFFSELCPTLGISVQTGAELLRLIHRMLYDTGAMWCCVKLAALTPAERAAVKPWTWNVTGLAGSSSCGYLDMKFVVAAGTEHQTPVVCRVLVIDAPITGPWDWDFIGGLPLLEAIAGFVDPLKGDFLQWQPPCFHAAAKRGEQLPPVPPLPMTRDPRSQASGLVHMCPVDTDPVARAQELARHQQQAQHAHDEPPPTVGPLPTATLPVPPPALEAVLQASRAEWLHLHQPWAIRHPQATLDDLDIIMSANLFPHQRFSEEERQAFKIRHASVFRDRVFTEDEWEDMIDTYRMLEVREARDRATREARELLEEASSRLEVAMVMPMQGVPPSDQPAPVPRPASAPAPAPADTGAQPMPVDPQPANAQQAAADTGTDPAQDQQMSPQFEGSPFPGTPPEGEEPPCYDLLSPADQHMVDEFERLRFLMSAADMDIAPYLGQNLSEQNTPQDTKAAREVIARHSDEYGQAYENFVGLFGPYTRGWMHRWPHALKNPADGTTVAPVHCLCRFVTERSSYDRRLIPAAEDHYDLNPVHGRNLRLWRRGKDRQDKASVIQPRVPQPNKLVCPLWLSHYAYSKYAPIGQSCLADKHDLADCPALKPDVPCYVCTGSGYPLPPHVNRQCPFQGPLCDCTLHRPKDGGRPTHPNILCVHQRHLSFLPRPADDPVNLDAVQLPTLETLQEMLYNPYRPLMECPGRLKVAGFMDKEPCWHLPPTFRRLGEEVAAPVKPERPKAARQATGGPSGSGGPSGPAATGPRPARGGPSGSAAPAPVPGPSVPPGGPPGLHQAPPGLAPPGPMGPPAHPRQPVLPQHMPTEQQMHQLFSQGFQPPMGPRGPMISHQRPLALPGPPPGQPPPGAQQHLPHGHPHPQLQPHQVVQPPHGPPAQQLLAHAQPHAQHATQQHMQQLAVPHAQPQQPADPPQLPAAMDMGGPPSYGRAPEVPPLPAEMHRVRVLCDPYQHVLHHHLQQLPYTLRITSGDSMEGTRQHSVRLSIRFKLPLGAPPVPHAESAPLENWRPEPEGRYTGPGHAHAPMDTSEGSGMPPPQTPSGRGRTQSHGGHHSRGSSRDSHSSRDYRQAPRQQPPPLSGARRPRESGPCEPQGRPAPAWGVGGAVDPYQHGQVGPRYLPPLVTDHYSLNEITVDSGMGRMCFNHLRLGIDQRTHETYGRPCITNVSFSDGYQTQTKISYDAIISITNGNRTIEIEGEIVDVPDLQFGIGLGNLELHACQTSVSWNNDWTNRISFDPGEEADRVSVPATCVARRLGTADTRTVYIMATQVGPSDLPLAEGEQPDGEPAAPPTVVARAVHAEQPVLPPVQAPVDENSQPTAAGPTGLASVPGLPGPASASALLSGPPGLASSSGPPGLAMAPVSGPPGPASTVSQPTAEERTGPPGPVTAPVLGPPGPSAVPLPPLMASSSTQTDSDRPPGPWKYTPRPPFAGEPPIDPVMIGIMERAAAASQARFEALNRGDAPPVEQTFLMEDMELSLMDVDPLPVRFPLPGEPPWFNHRQPRPVALHNLFWHSTPGVDQYPASVGGAAGRQMLDTALAPGLDPPLGRPADGLTPAMCPVDLRLSQPSLNEGSDINRRPTRDGLTGCGWNAVSPLLGPEPLDVNGVPLPGRNYPDFCYLIPRPGRLPDNLHDFATCARTTLMQLVLRYHVTPPQMAQAHRQALAARVLPRPASREQCSLARPHHKVFFLNDLHRIWLTSHEDGPDTLYPHMPRNWEQQHFALHNAMADACAAMLAAEALEHVMVVGTDGLMKPATRTTDIGPFPFLLRLELRSIQHDCIDLRVFGFPAMRYWEPMAISLINLRPPVPDEPLAPGELPPDGGRQERARLNEKRYSRAFWHRRALGLPVSVPLHLDPTAHRVTLVPVPGPAAPAPQPEPDMHTLGPIILDSFSSIDLISAEAASAALCTARPPRDPLHIDVTALESLKTTQRVQGDLRIYSRRIASDSTADRAYPPYAIALDAFIIDENYPIPGALVLGAQSCYMLGLQQVHDPTDPYRCVRYTALAGDRLQFYADSLTDEPTAIPYMRLTPAPSSLDARTRHADVAVPGSYRLPAILATAIEPHIGVAESLYGTVLVLHPEGTFLHFVPCPYETPTRRHWLYEPVGFDSGIGLPQMDTTMAIEWSLEQHDLPPYFPLSLRLSRVAHYVKGTFVLYANTSLERIVHLPMVLLVPQMHRCVRLILTHHELGVLGLSHPRTQLEMHQPDVAHGFALMFSGHGTSSAAPSLDDRLDGGYESPLDEEGGSPSEDTDPRPSWRDLPTIRYPPPEMLRLNSRYRPGSQRPRLHVPEHLLLPSPPIHPDSVTRLIASFALVRLVTDQEPFCAWSQPLPYNVPLDSQGFSACISEPECRLRGLRIVPVDTQGPPDPVSLPLGHSAVPIGRTSCYAAIWGVFGAQRYSIMHLKEILVFAEPPMPDMPLLLSATHMVQLGLLPLAWRGPAMRPWMYVTGDRCIAAFSRTPDRGGPSEPSAALLRQASRLPLPGSPVPTAYADPAEPVFRGALYEREAARTRPYNPHLSIRPDIQADAGEQSVFLRAARANLQQLPLAWFPPASQDPAVTTLMLVGRPECPRGGLRQQFDTPNVSAARTLSWLTGEAVQLVLPPPGFRPPLEHARAPQPLMDAALPADPISPFPERPPMCTPPAQPAVVPPAVAYTVRRARPRPDCEGRVLTSAMHSGSVLIVPVGANVNPRAAVAPGKVVYDSGLSYDIMQHREYLRHPELPALRPCAPIHMTSATGEFALTEYTSADIVLLDGTVADVATTRRLYVVREDFGFELGLCFARSTELDVFNRCGRAPVPAGPPQRGFCLTSRDTYHSTPSPTQSQAAANDDYRWARADYLRRLGWDEKVWGDYSDAESADDLFDALFRREQHRRFAAGDVSLHTLRTTDPTAYIRECDKFDAIVQSTGIPYPCVSNARDWLEALPVHILPPERDPSPPPPQPRAPVSGQATPPPRLPHTPVGWQAPSAQMPAAAADRYVEVLLTHQRGKMRFRVGSRAVSWRVRAPSGDRWHPIADLGMLLDPNAPTSVMTVLTATTLGLPITRFRTSQPLWDLGSIPMDIMGHTSCLLALDGCVARVYHIAVAQPRADHQAFYPAQLGGYQLILSQSDFTFPGYRVAAEPGLQAALGPDCFYQRKYNQAYGSLTGHIPVERQIERRGYALMMVRRPPSDAAADAFQAPTAAGVCVEEGLQPPRITFQPQYAPVFSSFSRGPAFHVHPATMPEPSASLAAPAEDPVGRPVAEELLLANDIEQQRRPLPTAEVSSFSNLFEWEQSEPLPPMFDDAMSDFSDSDSECSSAYLPACDEYPTQKSRRRPRHGTVRLLRAYMYGPGLPDYPPKRVRVLWKRQRKGLTGSPRGRARPPRRVSVKRRQPMPQPEQPVAKPGKPRLHHGLVLNFYILSVLLVAFSGAFVPSALPPSLQHDAPHGPAAWSGMGSRTTEAMPRGPRIERAAQTVNSAQQHPPDHLQPQPLGAAGMGVCPVATARPPDPRPVVSLALAYSDSGHVYAFVSVLKVPKGSPFLPQRPKDRGNRHRAGTWSPRAKWIPPVTVTPVPPPVPPVPLASLMAPPPPPPFAPLPPPASPPPPLPAPAPAVTQVPFGTTEALSMQPDGEPDPLPTEHMVRSERGYYRTKRPKWTDEQNRLVDASITVWHDLFAYKLSDMPGHTTEEFTIETIHENGVREPRRNHSKLDRDTIQDKCEALLKAGFIEPAEGHDYAMNNVCPAKKDADGNFTDRRFCQDARGLNAVTKPDRNQLPVPWEMFEQIGDASVISKLDCRAAFNQIRIKPEHKHKTAFWWANDLWQYTRMFYGLRNATACFQRVMDKEIVKHKLSHCCICFVDDVLVYSQTPEAHAEHLRLVAGMFAAAGLRAHPEKTTFAAQCVEFLGHMVGEGFMKPTEAKIAAIQAMPEPRSVKELQHLLGFYNFYRIYIVGYSLIAEPMVRLLCKGVVWDEHTFGEPQRYALQQLKDAFAVPGLALRLVDPTRPLIVYTDWSNVGIGAVLGQADDDGHEYLCACISRSLNKHERKYEPYKGELLAACWAVKTLKTYTQGREFVLVTDHAPLKWLMSTPHLAGQYARWAIILQGFDFVVHHRAGRLHQNADVLSRNPMASEEDTSGARLNRDCDPEPPGPTFSDEPVGGDGSLLRLRPVLYAEYSSPAVATVQYALAQWEGLTAVLSRPDAWVQALLTTSDNAIAHMPDDMDLLDGNLGTQFDEPDEDELEADHNQNVLQCCYRAAAAARLPGAPDPGHMKVPPLASLAGCPPSPLDLSLLGPAFWSAALSEGIVLYEPFGGMCAGLEMCLRAGVRIKRYLYSDISRKAHTIAHHRYELLTARYPLLFRTITNTGQAFLAHNDAFCRLPQNVRAIQHEDLRMAGADNGDQWLVVAGWECQDLSSAGSLQGLQGSRSSTFFDLVRILSSLQSLQPAKLPAFIFENAPMQHNWRSTLVAVDAFRDVCAVLGQPVCLDAARFGSRAHRVRDFWTNLASTADIAHTAACIERPPGLLANDILDDGWTTRVATRDDGFPRYACCRAHELLSALPTFVSYPRSHAYLPGEPGSLVSDDGLQERVPNACERERALGYRTHDTDAPQLYDYCSDPEEVRRGVLGRCMDAATMQFLLGMCQANTDLPRVMPGPTTPYSDDNGSSSASSDQDCPSFGGVDAASRALATAGSDFQTLDSLTGFPGIWAVQPSVAEDSASASDLWLCEPIPSAHTPVPSGRAGLPASKPVPESDFKVAHVWNVAAVEMDAPLGKVDVWLDGSVMSLLTEGRIKGTVSQGEYRRAQRRAARYRWLDGRLFRQQGGAPRREVPPPAERPGLVAYCHASLGHYGVTRTRQLLQLAYWWPTLGTDVMEHVKRCKVCDLASAGASQGRAEELHTAILQGLMYRWHIDTAGPFVSSIYGNVYLMIAIEELSKQIEVVAMPDKTSASTARALLSAIISRYAAPAEIVTDQGGEYQGAFAALLETCHIDHRVSSAGHPQSNGAAERIVQVIKRCLRKMLHERPGQNPSDWEDALYWVVLGYRCSKQASTKLSPYEMLYGIAPVVPPAVRERFEQPFQFADEPDHLASMMLARGQLLRERCAFAASNLAIAQHRDRARYLVTRSGAYEPRVHRYNPGDYVYLKRHGGENSLQLPKRLQVLRVVAIASDGVLTLKGRCDENVSVNIDQVYPCHLPDIDPIVDPRLARPPADLACEVCQLPDDGDRMLLCDGCGSGWHLDCLTPPLATVPRTKFWICQPCRDLGVTPATVKEELEKLEAAELAHEETEVKFPKRKQAAMHMRATRLHGKEVQRSQRLLESPGEQQVCGTLYYQDRWRQPRVIEVCWEDGSTERLTVPQAEKLTPSTAPATVDPAAKPPKKTKAKPRRR